MTTATKEKELTAEEIAQKVLGKSPDAAEYKYSKPSQPSNEEIAQKVLGKSPDAAEYKYSKPSQPSNEEIAQKVLGKSPDAADYNYNQPSQSETQQNNQTGTESPDSSEQPETHNQEPPGNINADTTPPAGQANQQPTPPAFQNATNTPSQAPSQNPPHQGPKTPPKETLKDKAQDKAENMAIDAAGKALAAETGGLSLLAAKILKNKKVKKFVKKVIKLNLMMLLLAILIPILLILVLIFMILGLGSGATQQKNNENQENALAAITLSKSVDKENAKVGDTVTYTINVSSDNTSSIVSVNDTLPPEIKYVSSNGDQYNDTTKTVSWENITVPQTLTITATVLKDNVYITNQAKAAIGNLSGSNNIPGDMAALLPPLNPNDTNDPATVGNERQTAINTIKSNPSNMDVYKKASAQTGIPWQIFAAIHYREGSSDPKKSLASGREIGVDEPDISESCAGTTDPTKHEDGYPQPVSQGCGFGTLLDTALYAARILQQKIGGPIKDYKDLANATAMYNGTGNANCDLNNQPKSGVDNTNKLCPRNYDGEDHPYAMNFYDTRHSVMYKIYCKDATACVPPPVDTQPGILTLVKWIGQDIK